MTDKPKTCDQIIAEIIAALAGGAKIRATDFHGNEVSTIHATLDNTRLNQLAAEGWIDSMANGGTYKLSDAGLLAYLRSTDEMGDGQLVPPNGKFGR